jgi:hypothetical protein
MGSLFFASYGSQGYGVHIQTRLHTGLRIICYPNEKANVIAEYLENQFISHDLYDYSHEQQVETRVIALFASVDDTPLGK